MKYTFLSLLFVGFCTSLTSQDLIPYRLDHKWGFADNSGKIIINPQYDKVRSFGNDGFAQVYKGSLCAILDKTGKEVIPFKYTEIFEFSDGLAAACKGGEYHWLQGEILGGEWGFINEKGEEIIPFNYYRVESFVNGYAIVQNDNNWGNWGVIDLKGKQILPFKYPTYSFDMRPFPGIRWDENEKGKLLYRPGQQDETWKQIDLTGKLTGKKVNDIHGVYPEENAVDTRSKNDKYALFDKNGKALTDYLYNRGIYFYDGLDQTEVTIDSDQKDSTGKYIPLFGIMDKKGKLVFPCEYPYIDIKNGVATLQNSEGNYALADMNGKFLTNWTEYKVEYLGENIFKRQKDQNHVELYSLDGKRIGTDEIKNTKEKFSEGLLGVCNQKKEWGYINTQGELVIGFKYQRVDHFNENFARVDMNIQQYKIPDDGLINKKGVEFFKNEKNIFPKYIDGKNVIVDEYERIIETDLKYAKKLDNGKIIYKDANNHYQIMDRDQRKYVTRELVDLIPVQISNSKIKLSSNEYYMGFTNDSSYIFDAEMNEKVAQVKDKDFKAFEYTQQTGLILKKLVDGYVILDVENHQLTKKYKYLRHVNGENFIAETADGKRGLINFKDEILLPFASQNLFVENFGLLIASTFSGKKLTNVDFHDFSGKKLNHFKIDHYRRDHKLNGFYMTENTKTKKYGYLYNGHISELKYDDVDVVSLSANDKFIVLKENDLYTIYSPEFTQLAGPFEKCTHDAAFFIVVQNGKYGLMGIKNNQFTMLLPCEYEDIPSFHYATILPEAIAVKKDGKYIYVDQDGKKSFDMAFETAQQFSTFFTRVQQNGKTGYLARNGEWQIQPNYDYLDYSYETREKPVFYGRKDKKFVFLNGNGENMLPEGVDSLLFDWLETEHILAVGTNSKYGIIDYEGNLLTPMKYDWISNYYVESDSDYFGLFEVNVGKKYGLVNSSGKEITPIVYDKLEMDDDVYASARLNVLEVKQNGKYGLLSFTGEPILPCEYDQFNWYFDGNEDTHQVPMKKKGKWGLIGMNGKIIIEPVYDKIYIDYDIQELFTDRSTEVFYSVVQNGKMGIISPNGEIIIPCEFKRIEYNFDCAEVTATLYKGKKQGILHKGRIIIPAVFDKITCELFQDQNIYITQTGKKYQFFKVDGSPLNDNQYDDYRWDGELYMTTAKRNNIWYELDEQGRETQSQE